MNGRLNGLNGAYRSLVVFIRDIGFPIFVAVYLMTQMTPDLRRLERMMERILVIQEQILEQGRVR